MIDMNANGDNNHGKLQLMAPSLQPALEQVKKCITGAPGFDLGALGSPDHALIGIGWLNASNANDLTISITELDEFGYTKKYAQTYGQASKSGCF